MSRQDLSAGRRWVERRFDEIAREFGTPRPLALEDRWREYGGLLERDHSMAYYIELAGHLTRGAVTFQGADLETAGTGEPVVRERLGRRIRDVLASSAAARP